MPVPQARILNPFVPRDDLGIEEDISNKLYLPSDVSLSLATMVGRNGRKPRIVQMDDDGNTLVSLAPRTYVGGFREFITLAANTRVVDGDKSITVDIRGVSVVIFVYKIDSNDDNANVVRATSRILALDKTSIINSSTLDPQLGSYDYVMYSNINANNPLGPYCRIDYSFGTPPGGSSVSAEIYLG